MASGRVEILITNLATTLRLVKAGKLRAIAVASPQRSSAFPDTPTVVEMGYPQFEISSNYGIIAPAAVPRVIIGRINEAVSRALTHADVKKAYASFGVDPWGDSAERYTAWLAEDVSRWSAVAKAIHFQPGL